MKRSVMMMTALTFIIALFVPLVSAQTQQPATGAQPAAQDPAKEEYDAYTAWYTAYKAQDLAKSLELGKAFLAKFPTSKYADFIKKDNVRVRGALFNSAVQKKDMNEMVRIGKEVLAEDPDNLDYLMAMSVQLRQNELSASPANYAHAAEASEFTERIIRLIEAGKTPTPTQGATFDKNKTLAFFHWTLAVVDDHNKDTDKAIGHYMDAAKLDPMNATYYFNCGRLHQVKYGVAATKYQNMPQADRDAAAADMKPEVKAALDDSNKEADAVINCWVRFLGLTATDMKGWESLRPQVEKAVTELYKYRNNDSTEGLQKLIDQNKGATAVSMPTPSATASTGSGPSGATTAPVKGGADQGSMSAKPNGTPAKTNTAPAKPTGRKPGR